MLSIGLEDGDHLIPSMNSNKEPNKERGSFGIYPNPYKSSFTIHYQMNPKDQWRFVLLEMLGRIVYEQASQSGSGSTTVSNLPFSSGVYFYKYISYQRFSANGNTYNQSVKTIKQGCYCSAALLYF
jgi:hypothetical protein